MLTRIQPRCKSTEWAGNTEPLYETEMRILCPIEQHKPWLLLVQATEDAVRGLGDTCGSFSPASIIAAGWKHALAPDCTGESAQISDTRGAVETSFDDLPGGQHCKCRSDDRRLQIAWGNTGSEKVIGRLYFDTSWQASKVELDDAEGCMRTLAGSAYPSV